MGGVGRVIIKISSVVSSEEEIACCVVYGKACAVLDCEERRMLLERTAGCEWTAH